MEDAPLNLAHFYERKANKFVKHNRFEEAIECLEISLDYIEEAFRTIQMPKALEVLVVQEEEYKRQIRQIRYKKAYFDGRRQVTEQSQNDEQGELKSKEVVLGISKVRKDVSPYKTKSSFNELTEENEYKMYEDERRLLNLDFRITEIPNLAPLELPNFDFQIFQTNACELSLEQKD